MFVMRRVVVLDHLDKFKLEIAPGDVDALDVSEELNGAHTLTISTTKLHLSIGDRVLSPIGVTDDGRRFDEWVVYGIKSSHDRSGVTRMQYNCIWFLQYDALGVYVDTTVGVTPFQPSVLKTAQNWFDGTIANKYESDGHGGYTSNGNPTWELVSYGLTSSTASAAFYNMDGWECIKRFIERWGAEVECHTDYVNGTLHRMITAQSTQGRVNPNVRFDFGWDVENVERTVHDGVWGCRVIPLGKSTQTESGGYTRRPTISSVNGGVPWLENSAMVTRVRRPKIPPTGSSQTFWFLPTVFAKNDVYEDPAELKAWALEHLEELTTPKVTYKVDAIALGEMGLESSSVRLGDTVAVVDRDLIEGGLRVEVRVRKIQYSMLGENQPVKLTLGNANTSITNAMQTTNDEVAVIREQMDLQQTT